MTDKRLVSSGIVRLPTRAGMTHIALPGVFAMSGEVAAELPAGQIASWVVDALAAAKRGSPAPEPTHPCIRWAQRAGYADWVAAVEDMKAGKVVVAQGPRAGKTTIDITLFVEAVRARGLHCYCDDLGRAWLGLKENFPKAILDQQDTDPQLRDLTRGLF